MSAPRWRVPAGQSLVYEELDDGVMLFDVLVGGTHLINATAAELLLLVEQAPGLTTEQLHARLAARLEVTAEQLPLGAVDDILQWLARLNIVAAHGP